MIFLPPFSAPATLSSVPRKLIDATFDNDHNVILMKIGGDLTVTELVEGYEDIFRHESFKPNMHAIWDLSALNLRQYSLTEIRQLAGELRQFTARRGDDYKAALVTNRGTDFQLLRLYLTILKLIGSNITFRLYRSLDEAYTWIGS